MSWRFITDKAKRSDLALKTADRLGRGLGRTRFFDCVGSIPPAPCKPDFTNWENHDLAAVWLGHASVLLRIGGLTVLADPVFSRRVGLGLLVATGGPRRLVSLPCTLKEMPTPDLILLSHAHFDHLDRPTLRRLPKSATVICAHNLTDLVRDLKFKEVRELEVEQTTEFKGLKITGIPIKHWGARVFLDMHRGYCAYLLESKDKKILFGADSAAQDFWKPIGGAGGVDLACVGIGAYNPYIAAHATPEQAAQLATDAGARKILPMHHSTFRLSHEPMAEPLHRFLAAVPKEKIAATQIGELWVAPR